MIEEIIQDCLDYIAEDIAYISDEDQTTVLEAIRRAIEIKLKREPDFVYDADSWEYTLPWNERDLIPDGMDWDAIIPVQTLFKGVRYFTALVPITFDDNGDPDEWEVKWFDTREEAEAAMWKPS